MNLQVKYFSKTYAKISKHGMTGRLLLNSPSPNDFCKMGEVFQLYRMKPLSCLNKTAFILISEEDNYVHRALTQSVDVLMISTYRNNPLAYNMPYLWVTLKIKVLKPEIYFKMLVLLPIPSRRFKSSCILGDV